MDDAPCNVVYVDRAAREDKLVERPVREDSSLDSIIEPNGPKFINHRSNTLDANLQVLLEAYPEVHVCTSGKSCIAKLAELKPTSIEQSIPTLVLIDIPYEDQPLERSHARTPSPGTRLQVDGGQDSSMKDIYGYRLLQWLVSDIQYLALSTLIIPVAVVSPKTSSAAPSTVSTTATSPAALSPARAKKYLDVGAVDVLTSPLLQERLPSLGIYAYRAHKAASKGQTSLIEIKRGRKRSWVGVENLPYQYLREAMVSGLMESICNPSFVEGPPVGGHTAIENPQRRQDIAAAIGRWHFSAHDFTDDELVYGAVLMLEHALSMPELENWRLPAGDLTEFLAASRKAYNVFVPYHNFRHVIDVLQATFHFLLSIGRLPKYPLASSEPDPVVSPLAALIGPFEALTLLITAIGHDVGHPGVNNQFLVVLNAPLAQLYNDASVLESFHCAAYSQILRRYWPAAFENRDMRKLMISSILATDMGLHADYMKRLSSLQEKLCEEEGISGLDGRATESQRALACSLLIKCADISNVARRFDIASQWTVLLTEEFSRQADMEKEMKIPSQLFAPPSKELIAVGKSQLGFMNMVATPLFEGVADVMPGMQYCVNELQRNQAAWNTRIEEEQALTESGKESSLMDGMLSPRSMSMATSDPGSATNPYDANNFLKMIASMDKRKFVPDESAGLGNYHSMPEISSSDYLGALHSPGKPLTLKMTTYATFAPSTDLNGVSSMGTSRAEERDLRDVSTERPAVIVEEHRESVATTGTTPLSPSTQGTSIGTEESNDTEGTRKLATESSHMTPSTPSTGKMSEEQLTEESKGASATVRALKKKSSRYRLSESFKKLFHKDKSSPPPMPDKLSEGV